MPDDRLARALLRLYPRPWRARYGEEFLALIADTGLTWRAAIDVVCAASVERARVLIALWRGQAEPEATLKTVGPANARELVTEGLAMLGLMAATALALASLGIPLPGVMRGMGLVLAITALTGDLQAPRPTTPFDRVALRFGQFAAAVGVVGLAWMAARGLISLGTPQPPDALLWAVLAVPLLAIWRVGFDLMRRRIDESWTAFLERAGWSVALAASAVIVGMQDHATELFWTMVCACWTWLDLLKTRRVQLRVRRLGRGAV
jgi:hypothetical protein